jgi:small-conductance mechanosensitive channel
VLFIRTSKSENGNRLPSEPQLRRELEREKLLTARARRRQAENVAYSGRIGVVARAILLIATIPVAVAGVLYLLGHPELACPVLAGSGLLGGGYAFASKRKESATEI